MALRARNWIARAMEYALEPLNRIVAGFFCRRFVGHAVWTYSPSHRNPTQDVHILRLAMLTANVRDAFGVSFRCEVTPTDEKHGDSALLTSRDGRSRSTIPIHVRSRKLLRPHSAGANAKRHHANLERDDAVRT